jgi:ferritin-like protein
VSLTRGQFVAAALWAGVMGADPALGQPSGVDQLERLLAFEHRLEAAYGAALERGAIDSPLGRTLLAQERDHVRGVELALKTLGRRGPQATVSPPVQGSALTGRRAFARFALALETQTVSAYVQVLATLDAPGLLQPLGSIMTAGAQHQVALRELLGEPLLGA